MAILSLLWPKKAVFATRGTKNSFLNRENSTDYSRHSKKLGIGWVSRKWKSKEREDTFIEKVLDNKGLHKNEAYFCSSWVSKLTDHISKIEIVNLKLQKLKIKTEILKIKTEN